MKYLIFLLALSGCAVHPEYQDNPYQAKAFELIQKYNVKHGTNVPVPIIRIGTTPNLDEGEIYCPSHADNCWITINESFDNERHGIGYAMGNTLPHELAHAVCVRIITNCTPNYHGKEWQEIALELGVPENDSFVNPRKE
jgi:hypothetical protein